MGDCGKRGKALPTPVRGEALGLAEGTAGTTFLTKTQRSPRERARGIQGSVRGRPERASRQGPGIWPRPRPLVLLVSRWRRVSSLRF